MSASAISDQEALATYGAETIAKGSKSFALASLFLNRESRERAQMLYAWCRHCDDVIDGQDLGGDAPDPDIEQGKHRELLQHLRLQTQRSIDGEKIGIPAFDAFGAVIRGTQIPHRFPFELLDGFQMDVDRAEIKTDDDLMRYCYGVAGVVGVMMAVIMGVHPDDDETLERACDLGLAFQLTNICRDVMDDAQGDRLYLPTDRLRNEGISASPASVFAVENRDGVFNVASDLLQLADAYYASASEGIKRLPFRAGTAIFAARNIYRAIGEKLKRNGPRAWDDRISISSGTKTMLASKGISSATLLLLSSGAKPLQARPALWSGPVSGVPQSQ